MPSESIILNYNNPLQFNISPIFYSKTVSYLSLEKYISNNKCQNNLQTLILISSLPKMKPKFSAYEIIKEIKISINNVFEIGNNCTSVLQGLFIAGTMNSASSGSALIYLEDYFSKFIDHELLKVKPSACEWNDFSTALLVHNTMKYRISVDSYVSITDAGFSNMAEIIQTSANDYALRFDNNMFKSFQNVDLKNEKHAIELALSQSKLTIDNIDFIITTNREYNRTIRLINALKIKPYQMITSRKNIGHTGGSDILYNLNLVLLKNKPKPFKILISANGLGYNWSSMVLSINQ